MTEATEATCVVAVLVARPRSPETLVEAAATGRSARLPSVVVGTEPSTGDVLAAVTEALGQPVTLLRSNTVGWEAARYDATEMVVEVEVTSDAAPPGYAWQTLDPAHLRTLGPEWAESSCQEWLDERQHGWSDLRPSWSRPGWFASAARWMQDQVAEAGYVAVGAPRIHYLWGISVVLVVESSGGRLFLKCSTETFKHEAVLTEALAERSAGRLPDVLAVEPEQGWLLMRELPAPELGDLPETEWARGLVVLADLQHAWLGRAEELLALGAQARPLAELASWVEGVSASEDLMGRLDPAVRASWRAAVPDLVDACHRLDELGPGPTLVHGDFHPWNVAGSGADTRVFDWTDGALSHPFVDLVSYALRAKDEGARQLLVDAYLGRWTDQLVPADLAEAGRLALVVGSLYQAQTYVRLVPTVMAADRGPLANGDVQWLRRALDRRTLGVHGAY